jgi:glycerate kinase
MPGAGAAGGLGAGAVYFLGARLEPGAEWLLNKIHIDRAIRKADFIITGEGKIDQQSWSGKLISNVIARTDKQLKQSILVCGVFEDSDKIPLFLDPRDVYSITNVATSSKDAMENASKHLIQIGEAIALKYL